MKLIAILFCSLSLAAQTKLFLRSVVTPGLGADTASGSIGYGCSNLTASQLLRIASTTAGSSGTTIITTPTNTAPPCPQSGSNYFTWYSPPLATGVTISGNIDFNISCTESNAALNGGMRMIVRRWDAQGGGLAETVITSADTAECGTCSSNRCAIAAAAPASTTFNAGDRLHFSVEVRNVGGGWGGNSSRTITMHFNAASGSQGDSFANFADTLSFSSDTNNHPAKGFSQ